MKPFVLSIAAGITCLPATYYLTRSGYITLVVVIIALIGVASGVLAVTLWGAKNKRNIGLLVLAFIIGALISEICSFSYYYINDGHQDPKLSVGEAVAILEFGSISIIGGLSLFIGALTKRRITKK